MAARAGSHRASSLALLMRQHARREERVRPSVRSAGQTRRFQDVEGRPKVTPWGQVQPPSRPPNCAGGARTLPQSMRTKRRAARPRPELTPFCRECGVTRLGGYVGVTNHPYLRVQS